MGAGSTGGRMHEETILSEINEPGFRELCEQAVETMGHLQVPGIALGILHQGEQSVAGFGLTNIEHPLPVNADTLFQIGSITKTFTGTTAMRLVDMGKLDLDSPVRAYLPDLRLASEDVAAQVTMRHLLTHTGGWFGDYFDDLGPGDDALAKMVEKIADLPQQTPLGEVWAYNNAGFYLAGRVLEVITGKTFEGALKELVLDPLGMTMSFFFARDVITHRFAVGHHVEDDEPKVARPWPVGRAAHPAGGIISNAKDLLLYAHFHMDDGTTTDGTRLLKPESMALMQSPQVNTGSGTDAIGITWGIRELDGTRIIEHGGGTLGQVSILAIVPDRNFAITVLTNADRGGKLTSEMTKWALRQYLGLDDPDPEPMDLSEEMLASYTGLYTSPMVDLELGLGDGQLVMQITYLGGFPTKDSPPRSSPPPAPLAFYSKDCVFVTDGPMKDRRGEFLRNADGRIAWLRAGGRLHARQKE